MTNQTEVRSIIRPKIVEAAFYVFEGKADTGPHATALFAYIRELETALATRDARIAELEKALEPFCAVLDDYDPKHKPDYLTGRLTIGGKDGVDYHSLSLGNFRKARHALKGGSNAE